jgi:hypothetical protein
VLSFDEPCGLVVAFAGFGAEAGALTGALVLDVDDGDGSGSPPSATVSSAHTLP